MSLTPQFMEPANDSAVAAEEVVLPLLAKPNNPNVILVEDTDALAACVRTLGSNTGPFALDAERASGFRYGSRAYLVQVARGTSPIYLIDPIGISPSGNPEAFTELAEVLSTDVWILHAATQDLGCLAELGLKPTALFDTELGGRIAGFPRVGLGAMAESLLGFRLAKEHSAVDWSTRPMQADWLNYAALDVDVLPALMDAVGAALKAQGKSRFATEEFEHLLGFEPKPQKADRWRAMTGLHEVKDQRKLHVAQLIWKAREQLAQKLDVSPGRLIPDSSIVAVAKTTPRSKSELAGRKDFSGRASRTYLDTWWKALDGALQANDYDLPPLKVPQVGIPNHRNWPSRFPEADARLSKLKPVMAALSELHGMPPENILTPDFMRQLAWEPPAELSEATISKALSNAGARDWQVEICAPAFYNALTAATA
jgi:ribonuclease D